MQATIAITGLLKSIVGKGFIISRLIKPNNIEVTLENNREKYFLPGSIKQCGGKMAIKINYKI